MEAKYKGISKKDILKIQKIHMPQYTVPRLDSVDWKSVDVSALNEYIDFAVRREAANTDIYIICEMAKAFLESMEDKE